MKQPIEIVRELVRLWDCGVRPHVVRGMQREEDEFHDLVRDAQEVLSASRVWNGQCNDSCYYWGVAPFGAMTKSYCHRLRRHDPSPGGRRPPSDCPRLVAAARAEAERNVETPLGEALDGHGDEVET